TESQNQRSPRREPKLLTVTLNAPRRGIECGRIGRARLLPSRGCRTGFGSAGASPSHNRRTDDRLLPHRHSCFCCSDFRNMLRCSQNRYTREAYMPELKIYAKTYYGNVPEEVRSPRKLQEFDSPEVP